MRDFARELLRSARLDHEPPTVVHVAQDAISWLSRAIAELDENSEEAPTSLAETLAPAARVSCRARSRERIVGSLGASPWGWASEAR